MIKKKICLIGSYAVGKTSLVRRFVHSIFSDKYHSTIGVKVDQKTIIVDGEEITLLIWDIHGEDEYQKIQPSYLKGSSGFFLVIDGTRAMTKDVAFKLYDLVIEKTGEMPCEVLINKYDLKDSWAMYKKDINEISKIIKPPFFTSAKTGENVEEAFNSLARAML